MPKIKYVREDILRPPEVKGLIASSRRYITRVLIAFLFGYGNRITEILRVKKTDVEVSDDWLNIKFFILKKQKVAKSGILPIYVKRLSVKHWLSPIIIDHVATLETKYVFAGRFAETHLSRQSAYNYIKELDFRLWLHLFRHSLATLMSENGATAPELCAFFNWESLDTASRYIRRTDRLRFKWSDRPF